MDLEDIVKQVDIERLYNHITELEGVKHHEVDPEKLDGAADYIKKELASYGLAVSEQKFSFDGVQHEFRNIEGVIGEGNQPEILITSHYDTVSTSPGADDNASAVAAMLEAARILAQQDIKDKNIRFISFTLEELHPVIESSLLKKSRELGLVDEEDRYLTHHTHLMMKQFDREFHRCAGTGKSFAESSVIAFEKIKDELTEKEIAFVKFMIEILKDVKTTSDWVGKTALIGSTKWVEQALKDKKDIIGVINLEMVGYCSTQDHSQKFPSKLFKLFPKYKVNIRKGIGNFIAVVCDKNSKPLANNFCKQCKNKAIDLPNLNLGVPFDFEFMAKNVRDTLKSDHAPFLRYGIPAIMISDTAFLRNPYYHTEADTI
ncbi:MAG: M28 family peptidase, partial [Candidatus Heimdallarchaeota archaeon]